MGKLCNMATGTAPTTNRTLVAFTCGCGNHVENFLLPTDARKCIDCKADDDRMVTGWTPENSLS